MSSVEIRLLGPLEVVADGEPVLIAGLKPKALLALLAIDVGHAVSLDRLIDALWGPVPPNSAVNAIQVYVAGIRRVIKRGITSDDRHVQRVSGGYLLDLPGNAVDAIQFLRLADQGKQQLSRSRFEVAAESLSAALELWRGDALAEFADMAFAEPHRARLEARRVATVTDRLETLLALGQVNDVIAELQQLVLQHPVDERLVGLLMVGLYRAGQQSNALRAYARIRDELVEELGLDVGPGLRTLYEQVLRQDAALDGPQADADVAAPGPRILRGRKSGELPRPITTLVGRKSEIYEALKRLTTGAHSVVTLVGPGGTGKTRVALEVGRRFGERFRDGTVFVGLATISHPSDVLPQLQRALDLPDEPGQSTLEVILTNLTGRNVLVILDNFEHVIEAAVDLATLTEMIPEVAILVTSREALRVDGEVVLRIPPLRLPHSDSAVSRQPRPISILSIRDSEAVQLFVERASAASGLQLTDSNAIAIASICDRLDGVPLALELAAARTTLLSPEAMLPRLEHSLSLLTSGPRNVSARQRSLRATMDWSWNLLSDLERETLKLLAWFPGGWSVSTAEEIFTSRPYQAIETLAQLVDKNMITVSSTGRFNLLKVIREYVMGTLTDDRSEEYRRTFIDWAVASASKLEQQYNSLGHRSSLSVQFELDSANFSSAIDEVAESREVDTLIALIASLGFFLGSTGKSTRAISWLNAALDVATSIEQRAELLRLQGISIFLANGDAPNAEKRQREALLIYDHLGDRHKVLRTRWNIAHTLRWQGRMSEALAAYESLVIEAEDLGWVGLKMATLRAELGELCGEVGLDARARELADDYLTMAIDAGDLAGQAYGTAEMALAVLGDDRALAYDFVRRSFELAGRQGADVSVRADVLEMVGIAEMAMSEFDKAEAKLAESAEVMIGAGYRLPLADTLSAMGVCAAGLGYPVRSARLFGAGADLRRRSGLGMVYRHLRNAYDTARLSISAQLSEHALQEAWHMGASASRSARTIRELLDLPQR